MPRIVPIPLDRPWTALTAYLAWVAATTIPLLLLACSDGGGNTTRTDTAGASPAVVTDSVDPVTGSSAAVSTAHEAIIEVSYDDAEQVFRSGEYREAAELFSAYTETKPENPWGHYMLGISAYRAGDLARAEQAFDRALELDPSHSKSYLNSARVLLDLGRTHEAMERVTLGLEHDSTSSDGLRLLARSHAALGDIDGAIATYQQALVLDDRDVWAMNNLGLLYIEQGRPEEALAPLARAVQLRGTAPVFQNNLGVALERAGHLTQAAEAYGEALRSDSSYRKAGISLERVQSLIDTAVVNTVDLTELAETFRLRIRMWREAAGSPEAPEARPGVDSLHAGGSDTTTVEPTAPPIPVAPIPN